MLRISILLSVAFFLTPLATGKDKDKDKNKVPLPADVLNAQTVLVAIQPGAGEPLANPDANRRAQEDVEKALMKWGRFRIVMEAQSADLVFAIRRGTGKAVTPTVSGGPVDNRPVILQPGGGGDIRIGGQRGKPPDLSQPGANPQQNTGPQVHTEIGPSEDMLEVYRGGIEYPLDSPAVWRYMAKDALRSPQVPAVDQFRKIFDEAQKAANQKQQKQNP